MGSRGNKEFASSTIKDAYVRQNGYCASCGTRIWKLGNEGAMWHKFGERAEAHHVIPVRAGGMADVANCVIVCRACHISAHRGGAWADSSFYSNAAKGKKPSYVSVETVAAEYPYYKFTESKQRELEQLNNS
jgi:hypothetical protein